MPLEDDWLEELEVLVSVFELLLVVELVLTVVLLRVVEVKDLLIVEVCVKVAEDVASELVEVTVSLVDVKAFAPLEVDWLEGLEVLVDVFELVLVAELVLTVVLLRVVVVKVLLLVEVREIVDEDVPVVLDEVAVCVCAVNDRRELEEVAVVGVSVELKVLLCDTVVERVMLTVVVVPTGAFVRDGGSGT
eukprot:TRINITY_DN10831_c0_g1_i8.p2 TRINITY_DN10831_c0_g1~~TRINITY_DN10831_c0_g1_i8.p2  ORF type:complete len:190 (-),score=37.93 TRINITY_DN10831_c0_g1_i8:1005-1574(-)